LTPDGGRTCSWPWSGGRVATCTTSTAVPPSLVTDASRGSTSTSQDGADVRSGTRNTAG